MGQFDFYDNKKTLYYSKALRESWASIRLQGQWFNDYPMLFDKNDLLLAVSQSKNHFFEWLGAIRIFEDTGYICLVEKYQFPKYEKQREIFQSIIPSDVYNLIMSDDFEGRQVPDLFAYSPEKSDWFFCEVKGETDRIHEGQGKAFEKIEKVSGKKIFVMKFIASDL